MNGLQPIGIVNSCFKQKFGIPRQPGLIPEATASLELLPPFNRKEAIRGLEGFSHLWLLFWFHKIKSGHWHPTVRPPRLGGKQRVGVFASRSPFRPNPIGLSVVRLLGWSEDGGRLALHLGGVDILDATPVLDIKPYIPYADMVSGASGGFTDLYQQNIVNVVYSSEAINFLCSIDGLEAVRLRNLITGILQQNPRPAYYASLGAKKLFGIKLMAYEFYWRQDASDITVVKISSIP
ncbi:hypothetical protein TI04_10395 [Achromatium sp. WMS2]|nr:hypothetical protein TI04_10395 [Achromatium sp. WMS2]